ncbi:DUF2793 domain-containing protein [Rhizobium sp. LjRoot258]
MRGQCHLVAEGAGGSWFGKDGMLALRQDAAWMKRHAISLCRSGL